MLAVQDKNLCTFQLQQVEMRLVSERVLTIAVECGAHFSDDVSSLTFATRGCSVPMTDFNRLMLVDSLPWLCQQFPLPV